ncbi:hypothetical protein D9756_009919 [Leucocoprinus leucothites]|uniref:DUF6534 domain-containing protein n=1 Tax=Leucocoprinus leucothites TaxID=201217 RepID=A0A8H5CSX7_9AGAR|nr:hypothetical protein D9756_009919 [Leucoagaricus leucothites]
MGRWFDCRFGVGFCYELQRLDAILSFVGNSEWIIYMGFGATTTIDIIITAMMCFVLYKTRMDIGGRRSDRLFRSLATYVVATGILTSAVSLLVIILYVARPNSLFYIAVTFSAPRLYTNSVFVMLDNFRRYLSVDVVDDLEDFEATSRVVFGGLTPVSPMRARATRSKTTNIDTSLAKGTSRGQRLGLTAGGLDSESSDGDVEAQDKGFLLRKEDVGPYSPYYSPLEARKKVNVMFGMQEPEEIGGGSWIDFWKVQRRLWLSWPVDRRSSL